MSTELSQWKKENTYTKLNFFSSDIPVIPDLEDVQEEDMMTQIAAPPRWDVTLPTGDRGGGNRQILLWSHTWSMYKKRTWWHILRPHPGGMLLYPWGGGGLQEFPKSGPILAFFVLIKGHTTIFFLFFLGGGGGDGGQLHLGIPSSKLDPCPWPLLTLLLSGMIKE